MKKIVFAFLTIILSQNIYSQFKLNIANYNAVSIYPDTISPKIDFSENGITNLKITPHNEEFRSVILNDGTRQGDFDRHPESMIRNLRNWKEMLNSN